MNVNHKQIIHNVLFFTAVFMVFGSGFLARYGYIVYSLYLLISLLFYPNAFSSAFFSRRVIPFAIFAVFYFFATSFDIPRLVVLITVYSLPLVFNMQAELLNSNRIDCRSQKRLTVLLYLAISFFGVQALRYIQNSAFGLRPLISQNPDDSLIIGGAYGLPYSLTILVPFILYIIVGKKSSLNTVVREKTSKRKILPLLFVLFGAYVVLRSTFTTAFILLLFGFVLVFVVDLPTIIKTITITFASLLVIPLISYLPELVSLINPDAGVMLDRLYEIDAVSQGEGLTEATDLAARLRLMLSSIKTFGAHPLFGIGAIYGYDYNLMFRAGYGGHSEWLDLFAANGIFAGLIIWHLIQNTGRYVPKDAVSTSVFVLMGFLNPIYLFQIYFVYFYLIPMTKLSTNSAVVYNKKVTI